PSCVTTSNKSRAVSSSRTTVPGATICTFPLAFHSAAGPHRQACALKYSCAKVLKLGLYASQHITADIHLSMRKRGEIRKIGKVDVTLRRKPIILKHGKNWPGGAPAESS